MTLKEFLETADRNRLYAFGAESGYFFIGTLDEWERDKEKIYLKTYGRLTASIERTNKQMETVRRRLKGEKNRTLREYYERRLRSLKSIKQSLSSKLSRFTPFQDREVIDTFEANPEMSEYRINVLISGPSFGNGYWMREEYQKQAIQFSEVEDDDTDIAI